MRRTARAIALLLITAALLAPARADVFLKYRKIVEGYEVKGRPVAPETTYTTLWLGPDRIRCDDGRVTLTDFAARAVCALHPGDYTYTRMPLDSCAAHMRRALRDMGDSPEARAARAVTEAMLQHGLVQAKVRQTRETRGISGLSCRRYVVTRSSPDGSWSGDTWVTQDIPADPGRLQMVRNSSHAGVPGFVDAVREMARLGGVPVLEITSARVSGRSMVSTEQLVEHGEKPAPPGVYDIPAGYSEKPWRPALGGGR